MNQKIKDYVIGCLKDHGLEDHSDGAVWEMITSSKEIFRKRKSQHRWWDIHFVVNDVCGMPIGFDMAYANRDESITDLGWEPDYESIVEVRKVEKTVIEYEPI